MTDSLHKQIAAELLSRRKAEASLYEFVKQAWPVVEGGREFTPGWHIDAICEHLQELHRGNIRNLLINIPPRFSKSSLCCVFFPVWCWIDNPNLQWVFTAYTNSLTIRDNVRSRRLIESPWFQTRWGAKFALAGDQNTKMKVENSKGGFRIATSVDAGTMGDGGDRVVIDDPNNTRDSSDVMLESTLSWWTDVMPTRLNDFKRGSRIVIQQRIHERDLTGHILSTEPNEWVKLILPMEFEPQRKCVTVALPSTGGKPWEDPRTKTDELLCPARVGPKELLALKRGLKSSYAIAGQLQQRPAPEAGGMFKREWFKPWKEPQSPKLEFVLASWDTALTESDKNAYSACTVWGVFYRHYQDDRIWTNGAALPGDSDALGRVPNVILLNMVRRQMEYPELRRVAHNIARDWRADEATSTPSADKKFKPDMNLVEAKANGLSLIQDLSRTREVFTKFNPDPFGDKMQRVRLITHLVEAGRIWLPCRPDGTFKAFAQKTLDQCLLFPNAASRDVVDTMTQALLRLQSSGWVAHPDDPGEPEDMRSPDADRPLY